MNEHDTAMMIAGRIAAALAAGPGDVPLTDDDFVKADDGDHFKEYGSFKECVLGGYSNVKNSRKCQHTHLRLVTGSKLRIARYSARLAMDVVYEVQRQLNASLG